MSYQFIIIKEYEGTGRDEVITCILESNDKLDDTSNIVNIVQTRWVSKSAWDAINLYILIVLCVSHLKDGLETITYDDMF